MSIDDYEPWEVFTSDAVWEEPVEVPAGTNIMEGMVALGRYDL